jgi:hypothetical protein
LTDNYISVCPEIDWIIGFTDRLNQNLIVQLTDPTSNFGRNLNLELVTVPTKGDMKQNAALVLRQLSLQKIWTAIFYNPKDDVTLTRVAVNFATAFPQTHIIYVGESELLAKMVHMPNVEHLLPRDPLNLSLAIVELVKKRAVREGLNDLEDYDAKLSTPY